MGLGQLTAAARHRAVAAGAAGRQCELPRAPPLAPRPFSPRGHLKTSLLPARCAPAGWLNPGGLTPGHGASASSTPARRQEDRKYPTYKRTGRTPEGISPPKARVEAA